MFFVRGSGGGGSDSAKAAARAQALSSGGRAETNDSSAAGSDGAASGGEPGSGEGGSSARSTGSIAPAKTESEKAAEKEALGEKTETGEVHVDIEMDPSAPECADDTYTLFAADGSFRLALTVKDDQQPGDGVIQLVFKDVPGGTTYTMEVDPGAEGAPYNLFENVPFKRLVAASK